MNTYTKLKDGSFGVRVVGDAFTGKIVSVQTKAGKIKSETIKTVLWNGIDKFNGLGKIALCSIVQTPRYSGGTRGIKVGAVMGVQLAAQRVIGAIGVILMSLIIESTI